MVNSQAWTELTTFVMKWQNVPFWSVHLWTFEPFSAIVTVTREWRLCRLLARNICFGFKSLMQSKINFMKPHFIYFLLSNKIYLFNFHCLMNEINWWHTNLGKNGHEQDQYSPFGRCSFYQWASWTIKGDQFQGKIKFYTPDTRTMTSLIPTYARLIWFCNNEISLKDLTFKPV